MKLEPEPENRRRARGSGCAGFFAILALLIAVIPKLDGNHDSDRSTSSKTPTATTATATTAPSTSPPSTETPTASPSAPSSDDFAAVRKLCDEQHPGFSQLDQYQACVAQGNEALSSSEPNALDPTAPEIAPKPKPKPPKKASRAFIEQVAAPYRAALSECENGDPVSDKAQHTIYVCANGYQDTVSCLDVATTERGVRKCQRLGDRVIEYWRCEDRHLTNGGVPEDDNDPCGKQPESPPLF